MKLGKLQWNHLMGKTDKRFEEALNWLRFVLNPDIKMPTITNWSALFAFAEKQALLGICLPTKCPEKVDNDLLLWWIGQVQLIEQQNKLLNKRIEQLFGMLEKDGFRCCLLKGQGNAELYPNPLTRCPGDIDVWIDSDEKTVYNYVKKLYPNEKETYKHIHFPIFNDAPVDMHVAPLKFYSGRYSKRLSLWIEKNKETQFSHKINLVGVERMVNVPTCGFNAVYQLGHMLIHTFDEGVGLRQVVDYYYVLKGLEISNHEREELEKTILYLGMFRFAQAIMWIESYVLGLSVERCLVQPNESRGQLLLEDILEGGNFGHYSQRYNGKSGFYYRGMVEAIRDLRLLRLAPREGIARLYSKLGTAIRHPFIKLKNQ